MATWADPDTVDDLDETQTHMLNQHVKELANTANTTPQFHRNTPNGLKDKRSNAAASVIRSMANFVTEYMFAVITSPLALFYDPSDTIYALVILPVIHILLFAAGVVFRFIRAVGGGEVWDWFDTQYGFGLSVANILDPYLLDSSVKQIHTVARKSLTNSWGLPIAPSQMEKFEGDQDQQVTPTRFFNLDIAKSFIILCALVYEREDKYVVEAAKIAKDKTLGPAVRRRQVAKLLVRSAHTIRSHAKQWGIKFSSISDFINVGGPFCGMFYPESGGERWIVLAFKGTTPTNFSEWLVDATLTHQNAEGFFGSGNVHQGFYASLAPGEEAEADPYANILHGLKHLAGSMRKGSGEKVNLWITGHSLGSGIASLLHARLLFSPEDLGADLVLRQGYMFGTPRVADADFISQFDFAMSRPFGDTTRSLWRVIDRWDVVTHIPPGLADQGANQAILPNLSLLNYGHFGIGVGLTGLSPLNPSGYEIQQGSLRGGSGMQIVELEKDNHEEGNGQPNGVAGRDLTPKMMTILGYTFDPIRVIKNVVQLTGPVADHIPANYWKQLQLVKADLEVGQLGSNDPPKPDE